MKKFHEDRDTDYISKLNVDNYIRADDTGNYPNNSASICNVCSIKFLFIIIGQCSSYVGKECDKGKITIYQFDVEQNECDEIANKPGKTRKQKPTKFRMKKDCEGASLFMQFVVLFSRNFKASSRNMVSFRHPLCPLNVYKKCSNFVCFVCLCLYLIRLVFDLCPHLCTFIHRADIRLIVSKRW